MKKFLTTVAVAASFILGSIAPTFAGFQGGGPLVIDDNWDSGWMKWRSQFSVQQGKGYPNVTKKAPADHMARVSCKNGTLTFYNKTARTTKHYYKWVWKEQGRGHKVRYDLGTKKLAKLQVRVKSCYMMSEHVRELKQIATDLAEANYGHGHHVKSRIYYRAGKEYRWEQQEKLYRWNTTSRSAAKRELAQLEKQIRHYVENGGGFRWSQKKLKKFGDWR